MTLDQLPIGETAVIATVGGDESIRQHLLDMGMIPGVRVTAVKRAPMGDPIEIRIHSYELTLRLEDAADIEIEAAEAVPEDVSAQAPKKDGARRSGKKGPAPSADHPGLGEGGKYHARKAEQPLPDDTILTFGLVGNQNSGKTTLFNQLTGASQHVGNFPGVTVDRKDGAIRGYAKTRITDLPGIYSMSPYSSEELVSRNFVLDEKPHALINIVDATNIERNLYLTMQLLELNVPMVVALNMMDEMTGNGGSVDINIMEQMLGVPVVPISAAKNSGIDELVSHAIHVAHYQERPVHVDFCSSEDHGGAVHRCLHAVRHLVEDHAQSAGIPLVFAAGKLIEGDPLVTEQLGLDDHEKEMLEHIVLQMEKERGLDRNAAIADMRFAFIQKVCDASVVKPKESREHIRSSRIDRFLTGKYTAIPLFIVIMGLVFFLTFNVVGSFLQDLMAMGIEALTGVVDQALTAAGANDIIHGLIVKGIFEGVGSVLSFLPIIVVLFFFLSILEDSGYIARVAFFMDKLLRRIGLSGRSIVPLLIGFGCSVPAIMATRTLPSARDRRMTILLTPFMSCTAKLPIYGFLVNAFFPQYSGLIMIAVYVLGILVGILAALIYKRTLFKGEAVPFVMELPNYRFPSARNVLLLLWQKAKDFLQRAFSIILVATIVIWFLSNFDLHLRMTTDSSTSIMAALAGFIAPVLNPLGLGDWRVVTSLISGFLAKESVVSVMQVLYPAGAAAVMSSLAALCMLAFSLIYTPCVAAISSVRREMGHKWAIGVALWQCVLAWIIAMAVRLIGMLFGMS